jgi:dTDP-4-amino-4,6-dideoxygalactose transaminase
MIPVTKSFLPPVDKYKKYIDKIWLNEWITNNGECVIELEKKLKSLLQVKHLLFVNNGTIAIQIAIKALGLRGEIITTPFSYVATTSSIVWENCIPVFADIDEHTCCISPEKIEKLINKNTSAILATHVYGNACDVEYIEQIAQKHNLKVIYDAAHAFGVTYKDQSILNYGDVSTLSFHATKVFHTVEGGAIVTNDDDLAHKISYLRNFGHNGQEAFWGLGINGKNSEMHAAMGLCNLEYIQDIIAQRKLISQLYDKELTDIPMRFPTQRAQLGYNYAYYPVILESEETLLRVQKALNEEKIFPRRYFYPSLNTLSYIPYQATSISEDISKRVLCLPLYHTLTNENVYHITQIIKNFYIHADNRR